MKTSLSRRWRAAALILAVLFALGGWADTGSRFVRARALLAVVPALDHELAWRSCGDHDATWLAYCRRLRPRRLMDAYEVLQDALQAPDTLASFVRARATIEPCMLRVGAGIESGFDYPVPVDYARRCVGRGAASDLAVSRTRIAFAHAMRDSLDTPTRLARLDAVSARYRALSEPAGVEAVQLAAAQLELELGDRARFRARLEAAHALASTIGDHYLLCQILGQLADLHEQAGQEDSMEACFAAGLTLARRHGFIDQAERFLLFEASRAIRTGRLALAADRLAEAVEVVESDGDRNDRLRLTLRQARFFAAQDCWDVVERTLRRVPVLMRDPQAFGGPEAEKFRFQVDLLRAQSDFADRHPEDAARRLEPWLRRMPVDFRRVGLAQLDDVWSEGLMHLEDWAGTLRTCERGLAHCDRAHVPELEIPLAFRRARALEALGRVPESRLAATDALRRLSAASTVDRAPWKAVSDVLRARLLLRAGDVDAGRVFLRRALDEESPSGAGGPDAGEHTGLSARDAAHELARLSPAEGYAFELAWRSRTHRAISPPVASDPFAPIPPPTDGTHLVYHFVGERLLRWTASPGSIRVDTLPVRSRDCLADVRQAISLLRTETAPAGRCLGARAERLLRRLGEELLPRDVVDHVNTRSPLEISPDGPLLSLPFEALVVPDLEGAPPLALVADVTYVLGTRPRMTSRSKTAVIVSNPTISPEVRRRYAWSGPLLGSDAETRCALRRWPRAILLRGTEATRARVLHLAAGAGQLYVAAHHVRDPGAPFLGFLPLAPDSGEAVHESLIEGADVRSLDLSGCQLAVLAACASGAPDRLAEHPGPSLGDAFLDAGAHAVVRSFWAVGDEETRAFMERFLTADSSGMGAAHALSIARRAAMREPGACPRVWAAWSIAETRTRPRPGPAPTMRAAAIRARR